MPARKLLVAVALAALLGACAHETKLSTSTETSLTLPPDATNTFDTSLINGKPHFATPEEAMRFLADAWNRGATDALNHVTNPSAREQLDAMHAVAVNLRLKHCDKNPAGDYACYFAHDFPPHASTTRREAHRADGGGEAVFLVGPADTPGWYMTVFERCS